MFHVEHALHRENPIDSILPPRQDFPPRTAPYNDSFVRTSLPVPRFTRLLDSAAQLPRYRLWVDGLWRLRSELPCKTHLPDVKH